jgi:hypothetical protein
VGFFDTVNSMNSTKTFVLEIIDHILREVLTAPQQACILASVITSNWGTKWNMPHFELRTHKPRSPIQRVGVQRRDGHGQYKKVRFVHQAEIDATVLRTSEYFHNTGINFLYGKNAFCFSMMKTEWQNCHPSLFRPGGPEVQPWPNNRPDLDRWSTEIQSAILLVEYSTPPEQLPGYIYYDQFLRFLRFVGPKNAARIKKLEFTGLVRRHSCEDCLRVEEDLLSSMRFYMPFINKFCTGLEKLVLHTQRGILHALVPPPDIDPATHEETMLSFLENEARAISSLRVLEVVSTDNSDVTFADPAIAWFKARAASRIREEMVEEEEKRLTDGIRANNIHCGFCAGEHVWAECWNLCNFCGDFGHFRKMCPDLFT